MRILYNPLTKDQFQKSPDETDQGIYISEDGNYPVSEMKTYSQWLATRSGYWQVVFLPMSPNVTIMPDRLNLVGYIQPYTVTAIDANVHVSVNRQDFISAILLPTIVAQRNELMNPSTLNVAFAVISPEVRIGTFITVNVNVLSYVSSTLTPTLATVKNITVAIGAADNAQFATLASTAVAKQNVVVSATRQNDSFASLSSTVSTTATVLVTPARQNATVATLASTVVLPAGGITYVSAGVVYVDGAATSFPFNNWPSSIQSGDLLVLYQENATGSAPVGWSVMTAASGCALYYKRTSGSESSTDFGVADDGGGEGALAVGRCFAFRGVIGSGNPWDVKENTITNETVSSSVGSALTTTYNGSMIVQFLMSQNAPTGVSGGIDTLSTDSVSGGWRMNIGYSATPPAAGLQTAPTITMSGSNATFRTEVALRKA
jgi:hypothetical protein